jgi:Zn-finger nucleic acid-binding protein
MSEEVIVSIFDVRFGKNLLGGSTFSFMCPACGEELETNEELILAGETCPTCSASIVFDEEIRQKIAQRIDEREAQQSQRKIEKERAAEERRVEKTKAAKERERSRELNQFLRRERAAVAAEKGAERKTTERHKKKVAAKDAKGPTLGETLAGFFGIILLIFGGVAESLLGVGELLVTIGFLIVICSGLSSIRTEIIRLKMSLIDVSDELP